MKNRAKCKKCNSIIESLTFNDYVTCECDEIGISGGDQELKCWAKDFSNFVRVDDDGNEIEIRVIEQEHEGRTLSSEEKRELVDNMIRYYEHLPPEAMLAPVTQYDMKAVYLLIKSII